MITILERLAAADEQAVLGRDDEGARALRLLEWPLVTKQIAAHCHNHLAATAIRQRLPYCDLPPITLHQQLADELAPRGDAGRWPPLADVSVALDLLAAPPPVHLDGADLICLAAAAESLDTLRDDFLKQRTNQPIWAEAAVQTASFAPLVTAIRRAIDRDGRVRDNASPTLARLRRACRRQEGVVRQQVDAAMVAARKAGWTGGPEVTLRGDRYCLPLRAGDSRRVAGIVHDRSASGGTLYVEPAAVVGPHNELVELRLEATAEESRILLDLNRRVEGSAAGFREACALLLLVDATVASMRWSRVVGGRRPAVAEGAQLRVCQARHPLLLVQRRATRSDGEGDSAALVAPQSGSGEVIPLDLELPSGLRVVVISGPNAGGKSVALKTVGLCCLLAQCGWDVPAREDTSLPLIRRIFVDLGDEQSIEQSLSSFSAHLGHLGRFLRDADPSSLVLCDEIGSGTDPQEGTALAFALLERLAERQATVLASTHFGLLKAAVHDHPAMINAAMDYDEDSLQPLFCLRLGVPGASHAFDIAARWGFDEGLLARARSLVGEERFQIEKLLAELGRQTRELAASEARLAEEIATAETSRSELDERLRRIAAERRDALAEVRRRGEDLVKEGRRAIEQAVREIREQSGDKVVIRRAREGLADLAATLPAEEAAPPPQRLPGPGDRIRIAHLGLIGSVVEVRGKRLTALANGLRLTLDCDAVELLPEAEDTPGDPAPMAAGGWAWSDTPPEVTHEVDLRGLRGDEAWQRLDQLIDRGIPAGLGEIRVIHGFGTGRLREFLLVQLAKDTRVATTRPASQQGGGHGVTVIRLAED